MKMSDHISVWVDNGEWAVEFSASKEPDAVWYSEGEEPRPTNGRDWLISEGHLRIGGIEDIWGLRLLLDEIEKEFE